MIIAILLFLTVAVGGLIGVLQMQVTKDYVAGWIERDFAESYNADLTIDRLDGFLPFTLQLEKLTLRQDLEEKTDTLAQIQSVSVTLDAFSLLQNTISITGFSVNEPKINLYRTEQETFTLVELFRDSSEAPVELQERPAWMENIEIFAPSVSIENGQIFVEQRNRPYEFVRLPEPMTIRNINAEMFLEISPAQRLWDIEMLSADIDDLTSGEIGVRGQLYNGENMLEFNAFNFTAGNSSIRLNGDIDGIDLFGEELITQLRNGEYDIRVNSNRFLVNEFQDLFPGLPSIPQSLDFELATEGNINAMEVGTFSMGTGESYVELSGNLENLLEANQFSYDLNLADVSLRQQDIEFMAENQSDGYFDVWEDLSFRGGTVGTLDSLQFDLETQSTLGKLDLEGSSALRSPFNYQAELQGDSVNIAPFFRTRLDTTSLNFDASISGTGFDPATAYMDLSALVFDSSVDNMNFDLLDFKSLLVSGFFEQEYQYKRGNEQIEGSGWLDFREEETEMSFQGQARNVNLANFPFNRFPETNMGFDYNVQLQGFDADRMQGLANFDVSESIISGDSVRSHQVYMDLDSPEQEERTFRLTSSLMDLNIRGDIVPSNLDKLIQHWGGYLSDRFNNEVLLDSLNIQRDTLRNMQSAVLDGEIELKDLALLRNYWSTMPDLESDARMTFNVNADSTRLLFSSDIRSDTTRFEDWNITGSNSQLTGSFQSDRTFKEFSNFDFKTIVSGFDSDWINLDSVDIDLSYSQDSLAFEQDIRRISQNATMNMALSTTLSDSVITVSVDSLNMGNEQYMWQNVERPYVTYNRENEVVFNDFQFSSEDEFFSINGTLSPAEDDSLEYNFVDINLSRISDIIDGDIPFAGIMNGNFTTQWLTQTPALQGKLMVDRFSLNDRLIGDISFSSNYNSNDRRFDTRLSILTDSTKYSNYLENNDDTGQNIVLEGFIAPEINGSQPDTTFHFDANFNEIDLWVLPLVTENIFQSMEGRATGEGHITGNFDDYDYQFDFQPRNVFAQPQFLNTNYFLTGPVTLNREDGVVLDSVMVTDTKGGSGYLSGTIDLNDFDPVTYLDLNMELDNLEFLNNEYDREVPFFGSVSGTGGLSLSGSNTEMLLETTEPINVTENSKISIPLLEETELDDRASFIQFVKEFNFNGNEELELQEETEDVSEGRLREAISDLSFDERFDLDLQFEAPENVGVELIFDPVTGEILTANGTGQMRITMQDEEVRMFGEYNILGGEYRFVSGEIISRDLTLEEGGSILWEGDPANARLDIEAVYSARPNIRSLNYRGNVASTPDEENNPRVPIELIIEINGSVTSVENDYYFRLPNSLDLSSNSTLSFAINELNRNEQQKFLQATSILLSGEFIPSESGVEGGQNLARGSNVINPLISNQVISPLLSNQINSLLNSDVSQFDIDFNLNAYNEIDLGIALRLYNDRLILRREGQITGGPENSLEDRLGDLNATYRINRRLSLTAFHRQDQTLSNVTGPQTGNVTPSVDGVGLEAEMQFNTWQDLKHRIANTFRRLFGMDPKERNGEEVASDTSSTEQ